MSMDRESNLKQLNKSTAGYVNVNVTHEHGYGVILETNE